MTVFTVFFRCFGCKFGICRLCSKTKNTRVGPFPWKRSVLQNPDRQRTNQSTGICLRLGLPYMIKWCFAHYFSHTVCKVNVLRAAVLIRDQSLFESEGAGGGGGGLRRKLRALNFFFVFAVEHWGP